MSETKNYRIEVMVNCDDKTVNKLVEAIYNCVEDKNQVDCAIDTINADTDQVVDDDYLQSL